MNMEEKERLPFFVYGTLMTGFGNRERCLRGVIGEATPATITGFEMFDVAGGGFPGIIDGSQMVVGELVFIDIEAKYLDVLARLDSLEGYRKGAKSSLYVRRKVQATDNSGNTYEAWVYVWNSPVNQHCRVDGNDWRKYVTKQH
jgi:gamma-glutamylcyclotransferase (GGCT)/AIG2-like uncharacterized protein YtfP